MVEQGIGPGCISKFCFDDTPTEKILSESEFIRKYGSGSRQGEKEGTIDIHCFKVGNDALFVNFGFQPDGHLLSTMIVSGFPNCLKAGRSKKSFGQLKTKEGLGLGASITKVIKQYGKPPMTIISDTTLINNRLAGFGSFEGGNLSNHINKLFVYGPATNPSLTRIVGFKNDKVVLIMLSSFP